MSLLWMTVVINSGVVAAAAAQQLGRIDLRPRLATMIDPARAEQLILLAGAVALGALVLLVAGAVATAKGRRGGLWCAWLGSLLALFGAGAPLAVLAMVLLARRTVRNWAI